MTRAIDTAENYPPPLPYEQLTSELSVEHPVGEMDGGPGPTVERKGYHAPRGATHEL